MTYAYYIFKKDEMNFALYSSNWTPMNIKFKKLLFFAMTMNDSFKINMKLTTKLIINLEMFASVCIPRLYYYKNKFFRLIINHLFRINWFIVLISLI